MRVAIGSDHAGFALKEAVKAFLAAEHREVEGQVVSDDRLLAQHVPQRRRADRITVDQVKDVVAVGGELKQPDTVAPRVQSRRLDVETDQHALVKC